MTSKDRKAEIDHIKKQIARLNKAQFKCDEESHKLYLEWCELNNQLRWAETLLHFKL